MPVETIECQIVQGQLGRYLAGDAIAPEVVRDMEGHIAQCPICRVEVAQRRATLHALLGTGVTPSAQAETNPLLDLLRQREPSTTTMPTHAVTPHLADSSSDSKSEQALTPRRTFSKPLIYSGALAVVLLTMNTLVKSPTSLLGPRLAEAAPAAASETKTTLITPNVADPAPAVSDRLFRAEWESLGFAELIEFDADLTDWIPAYGWLGLDTWSEAVAEEQLDEDVVPTEDEDLTTLEAWELFGIAELLSEPAPAPVPTTPRAAAPRRAPQPRPAEPAPARPSIRVYPPES